MTSQAVWFVLITFDTVCTTGPAASECFGALL